MGDSYQADRFKAAIKRIANYVGANSYDGISIQYFILKFKKNLCWIFQPTIMRAMPPRPISGYGKRNLISMSIIKTD